MSLSGYVLSMTGLTLPASMSSLRTTRSSCFGNERNGRPCWRTNSDKTNYLVEDLERVVQLFEDTGPVWTLCLG